MQQITTILGRCCCSVKFWYWAYETMWRKEKGSL